MQCKTAKVSKLIKEYRERLLKRLGKENSIVLCVFVMALLIRLAWVFQLPPDTLIRPLFDQREYVQLASNLVSGRGLQLDRVVFHIAPNTPTALRTPLYPLFLGGMFYLFGHNYLPIRLVQAFMTSLTCVFVYLIGKKSFRYLGKTDQTVGVIAAGISCLHPFLVFYTGLLMSENLYILLLAVAVYCTFLVAEKPSIRNGLLLGVFFGLTALTRPIIFYFLPVILLWLLLKLRESKKRAILHFGLVILAVLVTLSPWIYRNYSVYHRVVPLATTGGYVLWEGNHDNATGGDMGRLPVDYPYLSELSEVERDRELYRQALSYIKNHPSHFLKLAGMKFVELWRPYAAERDTKAIGLSAKYKIVGFTFNGVILLLSVTGMVASIWNRKWSSLLFLLIVYCTIIHMVFLGAMRYKLAFDPFLIIYAGFTLKLLLGRRLEMMIKKVKSVYQRLIQRELSRA